MSLKSRTRVQQNNILASRRRTQYLDLVERKKTQCTQATSLLVSEQCINQISCQLCVEQSKLKN